MRKKDLLIEIGTEELPPKALKRLGQSFANEIHAGLDANVLGHKEYHWYATPRRLAVIINKLVIAQDNTQIDKRGPALTAAFDNNGSPTRAAQGFARSCNVDVKDLNTHETDKGSWLSYTVKETGRLTSELLPEIINSALMKLPVPKKMRWSDLEIDFVRPIHWSVVLFGSDVLSMNILGTHSGNKTYGHRFHYPRGITLSSAKSYCTKLKDKGYVIADFDDRRSIIQNMVIDAATKCGGKAVIEPELLDEVTALVEWPVVLTGSFDKKFLTLPDEVLIATMQDHQKYFPITNHAGDDLINSFITISNIESTNPDVVRTGNERVIHPRLTDAEFFWQRDCSKSLESYYESLKDVVYQKQLGSVANKSNRVEKLAVYIASKLNIDPQPVQRAAHIAKCDLLTDMVGEFPELQGVMGRYYALHNGESDEVAGAIDEQYLPRYSGDRLPVSSTGQVLAIADKIDTIIGIFGIGHIPTGQKDPFGVRRAAIGILRIIIHYNLELDLSDLLKYSHNLYPDHVLISTHQSGSISVIKNFVEAKNFITERAKYYLQEQGYSVLEVESVINLNPNPHEYLDRLEAVKKFITLPEAAGLSEADKRIRNIINKSDAMNNVLLADEALMLEDSEKQLLRSTRLIRQQVDTLIGAGDFGQALILTAQLHGPVTKFFDNVMVNTEDNDQKINRFALLHEVANLTNRVANISKLVT